MYFDPLKEEKIGVWQGKLPGTAIWNRIIRDTAFLMKIWFILPLLSVKTISSKEQEQEQKETLEIRFLLRLLGQSMTLKGMHFPVFH